MKWGFNSAPAQCAHFQFHFHFHSQCIVIKPRQYLSHVMLLLSSSSVVIVTIIYQFHSHQPLSCNHTTCRQIILVHCVECAGQKLGVELAWRMQLVSNLPPQQLHLSHLHHHRHMSSAVSQPASQAVSQSVSVSEQSLSCNSTQARPFEVYVNKNNSI